MHPEISILKYDSVIHIENHNRHGEEKSFHSFFKLCHWPV